MRIYLTLLVFFTASIIGISQDCSTPLTLCNQAPLVTTNDDMDGSAFSSGCLTVQNSAFYEFTTNDNALNPGAFSPYEVTGQIALDNCLDAGIPLTVSAAIYQPADPLDLCGALTEIASCVSSTDTITINSGQLEPNTQYVLVVGYDFTLAGTCSVEVTLSGPPLTVDACCDANIPAGLSTTLTVTGGTITNGSANYVWQPLEAVDDPISTNPIASPTGTTIYTVEAEVGNCIVTDQITVTVVDAVEPKNAFTPNGDGVNDTWTILRIENFDSALITVYDRWGQEIYKTIGYADPWDGTNDGKTLPTGTYYYTIELNSLEVESEPFVGFVFISH